MTVETIPMLIGGEWVEGATGATIPVINPATEEVIANLAHAAPADLDRALDAADRAWRSWKDTTAAHRAEVLARAAQLIRERQDEIARILTAENGKSLAEAAGEVGFCADAVLWYAEEAKRAYGRVVPARATDVRQLVLREPVGVALGFAAWNFPGGNVALKMAAALAAGCSIIVKPSDETPATAIAIGRCFVDAGVPAGALNIVHGVPSEVSEHLIASPIPRKVSLTGSTPVGKLLQRMAADTMKRCTMELGGHAPVLVFADADLDNAVERLVAAKFRNAGQVCTSPTRFFVHRDIFDRFVDAFVERSRQVVVGNGAEGAQMGPMITEKRREAIASLVADAVERGAELRLGGEALEGPGYFYAPTVLANVPDDARLMHEEPFGPVAAFVPFDDFDAVIARANALPYGLAAYVFSQSPGTIARASAALEAGAVGINHTSVHEAETPFGGIKESGYGAESGMEGLDAYLRTKMVSEKFL
ncbi:NAD-dependent succinate-semialdehyde dehydrogenase [Paracoccus sp. P2]|uniref:NAD-dependent succinate-semialdehyde dehydrogenase n=1 Tax=Paracoccus TaxID=265 RepID=UPI000491668C|nr:NAD-dependent succinate-semialdehyde dehydrogenase [Paracoccus pantotrophus]MDF3856277.1 NAD-dependent succinate-semialdehyde dehydrogenase [Paracoccus pantotrophus]RNI15623.1 NAD-dependent succinate-semialdehyde dehydrogenase [Paracoccus pantotrophus]SFP06029.1 succinate-semialdehyde dehydrogenase / glutarate-semialdehyde dehydrogenase [Paracoccus pantotrophus]